MPGNENAPVVATGAFPEDRLRLDQSQSRTAAGHSFLARYLSEFADARAALRGQLVCVRFTASALAHGLCDVSGRVKATDRTGLLLVTPGNDLLDGSEVVILVPWRQIERVSVGWSEDVFPDEVPS